MNFENRKKDILSIISSLDISPTLYENAVKKYKSISNYLLSKGLDVEIYPQGSFALGTVTRPYSKDNNASYDLDFICQVKSTREDITPKQLRKDVQDILSNSDLYGGKLEFSDKCITVRYADIDGLSFSIDVVPAAGESEQNINALIKKSPNPDLIKTSIAIPSLENDDYRWVTNNPKGYKVWFDKINEPFQAYSRQAYRQHLFESHRDKYGSVEEIPNDLERSSLQRVIQILKYHRNVYYSKLSNGDKLKPIAAIIGTLVCNIAQTTNVGLPIFDLLTLVLDKLYIYSRQRVLTEDKFAQQYVTEPIYLRKIKDKWVIPNPANPDDNLADNWTDETAENFFRWAEFVRKDLINSLQSTDSEFRLIVENAFGRSSVTKSWGNKYSSITLPEPTKAMPSSKPWRIDDIYR